MSWGKVLGRRLGPHLAAGMILVGHIATVSATSVQVERAPSQGIQPDVAVEPKGTVHLIYYKGDPRSGNIFYVKKGPKESDFSEPLRVNSQAGSALAIGTVRGPAMALGKNGRVHVAWMGSAKAKPKANGKSPMLYSRLKRAGSGFEEQRNLVTWAGGLDGGGTVAADRQGNVYVAWQGSPPENDQGEQGRAVFVACSSDGGGTFDKEVRANPKATGACACCGIEAFASRSGDLALLYRTANGETRDMAVLRSKDQTEQFDLGILNRWAIQSCPMSTGDLQEGRKSLLAATEKAGRVYYHRIADKGKRTIETYGPFGKDNAKHPVVATNPRQEVLLAWTEGTGWQQGGSLHWQVFSAQGGRNSERGSVDGVPVWGRPSAYVKSDGDFVIFF